MTKNPNGSRSPAADPSPVGGGRFVSTAWTEIREAQQLDPKNRTAVLGPVLSRYWKPLYAYYRAHTRSPQDAEDLVQGLLTVLLESDRILQVHEDRGRFRDWLIVCARNYLYDRQRQLRARKRRPEGGLVSLEALRASDGEPFEAAVFDNPEQSFHDAWRRDLLERALREVRDRCRQAGREVDFEVFTAYYLNPAPEKRTWKQVAEQFGLRDWKEAASRGERIKGWLAAAIRGEVRRHVASESEVDAELRDLFQ